MICYSCPNYLVITYFYIVTLMNMNSQGKIHVLRAPSWTVATIFGHSLCKYNF